MLRAAGWTVGLFGAGAAISRLFTSPWAEPIVLFALGMAFLFVSKRTRQTGRSPQPEVAKLPARKVLPPAPAPVGQPVPVEQSA